MRMKLALVIERSRLHRCVGLGKVHYVLAALPKARDGDDILCYIGDAQLFWPWNILKFPPWPTPAPAGVLWLWNSSITLILIWNRRKVSHTAWTVLSDSIDVLIYTTPLSDFRLPLPFSFSSLVVWPRFAERSGDSDVTWRQPPPSEIGAPADTTEPFLKAPLNPWDYLKAVGIVSWRNCGKMGQSYSSHRRL